MAKQQTKQYGLKGGHPNIFRRTVNIGTKASPVRVQLVFEPGTPVELTDKEIEGLKPEISEGFIVPWEQHGHGQRPVPNPTATNAQVDALQGQVDELAAQNAELTKQLAETTATPKAAELKALKQQVEKLTSENAELTKQLEDATAPAESDEDDASEIEDPDAKLGDE